jgi:predicted nuclease of restriction endonuclease-like (RecB) superfamily
MTTPPAVQTPDLHEHIRSLLLAAKSQVRQTVNTAMVQTYWHIGRLIVEDEQGGQKHAAYGKHVLLELSKRLTTEFGAGFSVQGLRNYRQFYLQFPIRSTVWSELSWSHFKTLLRVENQTAREWYANESAQQGWSVRALDRQITTLFYERLLGSQDKAKAGVALEAATNITAEVAADPRDFIRNPSPPNKGFAFVSRQKCAPLPSQRRRRSNARLNSVFRTQRGSSQILSASR